VKLPERVRKMGRFQTGGERTIWWSPPDEIVMRKEREQSEEKPAATAQVMKWVRKVSLYANEISCVTCG